MQHDMSQWTSTCVATELDCKRIEEVVGVPLPKSYRDFVLKYGFGAGIVGEDHFIFWNPKEIIEYNKSYEVNRDAPGLTLFGGDGGGWGFAFDTRTGRVRMVMIPLLSLFLDEVVHLGDTMDDVFACSSKG